MILFFKRLWFTLLYKLDKLDSTDKIVYLSLKKNLSKEITNGDVLLLKK